MLRDLDPSSDRAVFRQIADHLRDAVKSGELAEGERLPSETQLMEHYGVARATLRQALGLLQAEGLTRAEHGRGVFVRPRPPVRRLASDRFARRHRDAGKAAFTAEVEAAGRKPSLDMLSVQEDLPPTEVRELLRLPARSKVVVRRRRYLVDGRPVELATSYIPTRLARGTAIARPDTGPGGIYARLEEAGHRLERFTEDVSARMPTPEEARVLELVAGVPVFRLVRTAHAVDGPVEVCDTIMASDSFVLGYELPAE